MSLGGNFNLRFFGVMGGSPRGVVRRGDNLCVFCVFGELLVLVHVCGLGFVGDLWVGDLP
jgi:hypothetical protein